MVSFRFRFTPDGLREAIRSERRLRWGWRIGPLVGLLVLGLSGYTLFRMPGQTVLQIPLLMLGLGLLCAGRFQDYGALYRMRRDPIYREEITWTVDSEGLRWVGEGFVKMLPWSAVERVREAAAGYAIYPAGGGFYWLPKSALPADSGVLGKLRFKC